MPAVDQPVIEVDRREVDKDVMFHFTIITWSTAAMLFSFISLSNKHNLYKKREHLHNDLQYIQTMKRT
jgi:hypothetical protein